jgi:DinB superfamily
MSVFTNPASSAADQAKAYVAAVLELLGDADPLDVLRQTPSALQRTIKEMLPAQIGRPEAPGKWSVGQVVQHLADSELVWGYRLRMVLAHDRPQLSGYDQDLWADRLRYGDADPHDAVECFGILRRANLRLLEQASDADLHRVGVHVERGEESLSHMVQLYAGHDLLHLRQLDRIRGTSA